MKMRVLYSGKNKQLKTYAEAISQATKCTSSAIPPLYPVDNEKLVILGFSGKKVDDKTRLFCSQLIPTRTKYVALFIDGKKGSQVEETIRNSLLEAGTNVIDCKYYIKCNMFSEKITIEQRQDIVDWSRKVCEMAE